MKQSIWFYTGIIIISVAVLTSALLGYVSILYLSGKDLQWATITLLVLSSILFTGTVFILKHTTFDSERYLFYAHVVCFAIFGISIFIGIQMIMGFMETNSAKIATVVALLCDIPLFIGALSLYRHITNELSALSITPYYLSSFNIFILITTILCSLQIVDMYSPFLKGEADLPSFIGSMTVAEVILLITPIARIYLNDKNEHVDYNARVQSYGIKNILLYWGLIQCLVCAIVYFQSTYDFLPDKIWRPLAVVFAIYILTFSALLFSRKMVVKFDKSL